MRKRKVIVRITQILIIVITVIATKKAIDYTKVQRGYEAMGGEYVIPVIGFLIVMIIEEIYREYEKRRIPKHEKKKKRKKRELSIDKYTRK